MITDSRNADEILNCKEKIAKGIMYVREGT